MRRPAARRRWSVLLFFLVSCAFPPAVSKASPPAPSSLKAAVDGRFLIGAAINLAQIQGRDTIGSRLIREHFTSVSPENVLKWKYIHPEPGGYAFAEADSYVSFAERNGLVAIGHTLVWQDATPQWVFHDSAGRVRPRAAVLAELQNHINTVVGRYKGRIHGWDVVNEVLSEDGSLRASPWLTSLGEGYIATAFRLARQADPGAELYINDNRLEGRAKLDGMVRLLRRLEASGIRVDAVGIEAHYHLHPSTAAALDTAITTFERMGYRVMLTELDVDVLPYPNAWTRLKSIIDIGALNPFPRGLPDSAQRLLAERYAEIFRVILQHPGNVTRVTFWGVHDGASWRNDWPIRGRTNYPLLFDRRGQPKAAYWSTIAALTRAP